MKINSNILADYYIPYVLISLFSVILIATPATLADESPIQLSFGVYSSNKPTTMVRVFKPTLNALETNMTKKLGRVVKIRMQIAKDYDQGVADLVSGKVDFARFGPASYLQAKSENQGLTILAMESKNKQKVFYGIIAVHAESEIKTVEDLRHRTFAFGDESSTIGRYLPQRFFVSHNIYSSDLSGFKYLGRHDSVGMAVGAKAFDAGALNESTFKKLVATGQPIRELTRFPNVTKPWIAREGLDAEVLTVLQTALYQLKEKNALRRLKIDGFLPCSDEDYETIRQAMNDNHQFFKTASVMQQ